MVALMVTNHPLLGYTGLLELLSHAGAPCGSDLSMDVWVSRFPGRDRCKDPQRG